MGNPAFATAEVLADKLTKLILYYWRTLGQTEGEFTVPLKLQVPVYEILVDNPVFEEFDFSYGWGSTARFTWEAVDHSFIDSDSE